MLSTRRHDEFDNCIEENDLNNRSSIIAREISFSQNGSRFGEIILLILPYLILLFDIFLFFLLRGF